MEARLSAAASEASRASGEADSSPGRAAAKLANERVDPALRRVLEQVAAASKVTVPELEHEDVGGAGILAQALRLAEEHIDDERRQSLGLGAKGTIGSDERGNAGRRNSTRRKSQFDALVAATKQNNPYKGTPYDPELREALTEGEVLKRRQWYFDMMRGQNRRERNSEVSQVLRASQGDESIFSAGPEQPRGSKARVSAPGAFKQPQVVARQHSKPEAFSVVAKLFKGGATGADKKEKAKSRWLAAGKALGVGAENKDPAIKATIAPGSAVITMLESLKAAAQKIGNEHMRLRGAATDKLPLGTCCHDPSICPIDSAWTCVSCGTTVESGVGGYGMEFTSAVGGGTRVMVKHTDTCCGAPNVIISAQTGGWVCRYCGVEYDPPLHLWLPNRAAAERDHQLREQLKSADGKGTLDSRPGRMLDLMLRDREGGVDSLAVPASQVTVSATTKSVPLATLYPRNLGLPKGSVLRGVQLGSCGHCLMMLMNAQGDYAVEKGVDFVGRVLALGQNYAHQLGLPDKIRYSKPRAIAGFGIEYGREIVACDGGRVHSIFVTAAGEVFATGRGRRGQLGLGWEDSSRVKGRVGRAGIKKEEEMQDEYAKVAAEHSKIGREKMEQRERLLKCLNANKVFADVSEASMRKLLNAFTLEKRGFGETICTKGEIGDTFYVVETGRVEVIIEDKLRGTTATRVSLYPGQSFGEMALLFDIPRTATVVVAEKNTSLFVCSRSSFNIVLASQGDSDDMHTYDNDTGAMEDDAMDDGHCDALPAVYADAPQQLWFLGDPSLSAFQARIASVACGDDFTILLSYQGGIFGFGANDKFQLGLNDAKDRYKPTPITALQGYRIGSIAAGAMHAAAVTKDGVLFTWGYGCDGQLGHGGMYKGLQRAEEEIEEELELEGTARALNDDEVDKILQAEDEDEYASLSTSLGVHSAAAAAASKMRPIGAATPFRVRHNSWARSSVLMGTDPEQRALIELKRQLKLASEDVRRAAEVGNPELHRLAAQKELKLRRDLKNAQIVLSAVESKIDLTGQHPFAQPTKLQRESLRRHGKLRPDQSNSIVDETLQEMDRANDALGATVIGVACGARHTIVVTSDGYAWAFGDNAFGQLGLPPTRSPDNPNADAAPPPKRVQSPVQVLSLIDVRIVSVAAGAYHSLFLTNLGLVYACGRNHKGQLGDGTKDDRSVPQSIQPEIKKRVGDSGVQSTMPGANSELKLQNHHPLSGVRIQSITASGNVSVVQAGGGSHAWIMGAAAGDEAGGVDDTSTDLESLLAVPLDDNATKKVLVVTGAIRLVQPHETRFEDIEAMAILYGLYTAPVLAHIVKAIFEHLLDKKDMSVPLLAKLTHTLMCHTLSVSRYQFRRIIMFGFEYTILRLMAFFNAIDTLNDENDGNATSIVAPSSSTLRDPSMLSKVHDRKGVAFLQTLRNEGKLVRGYVRELYRLNVVEELDVQEMELGLPGSLHSRTLIHGWEAERKMALSRSLLTGVLDQKVDSFVASMRRPGYKAPEPLRPVPFTAAETAAHQGADKPGWEPYTLKTTVASVVGARRADDGTIVYTTSQVPDSYEKHLEQVRKANENFVFGVVSLPLTVRGAHATVTNNLTHLYKIGIYR